MTDSLAHVRRLLREVPDFPTAGNTYIDSTPVLAETGAFTTVLATIDTHFRGRGIEAIAAIEAGGFIFGAALAARMGVGLVPLRTPGKLPGEHDRVVYAKDQRQCVLEMHRHALRPKEKVLLVDDVLATGTTANAAITLLRMQEAVVIGVAVMVANKKYGGRANLPSDIECFSVLEQ